MVAGWLSGWMSVLLWCQDRPQYFMQDRDLHTVGLLSIYLQFFNFLVYLRPLPLQQPDTCGLCILNDSWSIVVPLRKERFHPIPIQVGISWSNLTGENTLENWENSSVESSGALIHSVFLLCSSPGQQQEFQRNTHKSGDLTAQLVLTLAVPWFVSALIPTPGTKAKEVFGKEKALIFML